MGRRQTYRDARGEDSVSFGLLFGQAGEVQLMAMVAGGQKAWNSDGFLTECGTDCFLCFRTLNFIARDNRCDSLRMHNNTKWSGCDCHRVRRESFGSDQNRKMLFYSPHFLEVGTRSEIAHRPAFLPSSVSLFKESSDDLHFTSKLLNSSDTFMCDTP
jgi:hypothetical protein